MKHSVILILLFFSIKGLAQAPKSFKYQAIIRESNGVLIANRSISVRITILSTSIDGDIAYVETHQLTSSETGIINLEIGKGSVQEGDFNNIKWGSDSHFVKVDVDRNGGTSFESVGVSQLLSVPYALYAEQSGDDDWDEGTGGISYTEGNVGIGTTSPSVKLEIDGQNDLNLLTLKTNSNSLGINSYVTSNTDFHGSAYIGRRARGTFNTPLTVAQGDRISGIYGSLFADGGYQNSSAIHFYVGANPGSGSYPSNIRFETTNTGETIRMERMRISENGNVGIGNSNPEFLLDVAGSVNASSFLIDGAPFESGPWTSGTNSIYFNSGGVAIGKMNPSFPLDVNGAVNASSFLINGAPLETGPWIKQLNSTYYNSGNVGIGTTSPSVKLEIDGQNDLNLLTLKTNSNSLGINSYVTSNTDFHGSAYIGRRARGTFNAPLTVAQGDRISGIYGSLFADGGYQNSSAIHFYVGANPGSGSYPSNIRFETTNTGETLRTERMRISENGNIEVKTGDVFIENIGGGVIMRSPNGQCWRMTVDNSGAPVFNNISCPN